MLCCLFLFLWGTSDCSQVLTLGRDGHASAFKGHVDTSTIPEDDGGGDNASGSQQGESPSHAKGGGGNGDLLNDLRPGQAPPLKAVLNLHDFEAIAQTVMTATGKRQAWDYYSSGADDELTYVENVAAFQRIWLRPRILVDVGEVDTSCELLGTPASMPV